MQTVSQPTGRRAARLATIDAAQGDLVVEDMIDSMMGLDEVYQYNLEARNLHWSSLEGERLATLAV